MTGVKYDQDKPDYSLLPYGALEQVVQVLTYGSKKYDRNNWEHVPDLTSKEDIPIIKSYLEQKYPSYF